MTSTASSTSTSTTTAPTKTFVECAICCEQFDSSTLPRIAVTSCEHYKSICKSCHVAYLKGDLVLLGGVKCLFKSCTQTYSAAGLVALLGTIAGSALQNRSEEVTFLQRPGAMLCIRPNCRGRILKPTAETTSTTTVKNVVCCPTCAMLICTNCVSDQHEGYTCDEAAAFKNKQTPSTTEQFLNAVTKRCPNCFLRTLKQGGCPHMTCTQCKFNYCWGCLKPRQSHSAIQDHPDCARRSSEFEAAAEQKLREFKRAAKEQIRRERAAAITAAQLVRAGSRVGRVDVDVVVIDNFFDDDSVARLTTPPTTATSTDATITVESTTILRKLSSNTARRLLALSF